MHHVAFPGELTASHHTPSLSALFFVVFCCILSRLLDIYMSMFRRGSSLPASMSAPSSRPPHAPLLSTLFQSPSCVHRPSSPLSNSTRQCINVITQNTCCQSAACIATPRHIVAAIPLPVFSWPVVARIGGFNTCCVTPYPTHHILPLLMFRLHLRTAIGGQCVCMYGLLLVFFWGGGGRGQMDCVFFQATSCEAVMQVACVCVKGEVLDLT